MLNTIDGSISLMDMYFPMCGFCGFEMGNGIFPISTSICGFLQNFPVQISQFFNNTGLARQPCWWLGTNKEYFINSTVSTSRSG